MKPFPEIQVYTIGAIARELLAEAQHASPMGTSSRGVFLLLDSGWVVFLSGEPERGPLTLNLQPGYQALERLRNGATAQVSPSQINFPDANVALQTRAAVVWEAPPRPGIIMSPRQRQRRLRSLARQVLESQATSAMAALLAYLLGLQLPPQVPTPDLSPWLPRLERLQGALQGRNAQAIVDNLSAFLGLGEGLTPCGDDLVLGFLLATRRWGQVCCPHLDSAAIYSALLERAYARTTTLSANLIECAGRGQADERLMEALDGLICGDQDTPACARRLQSWGHSSGVAALVGMILGTDLALVSSTIARD